MTKPAKNIPHFKSEAEERAFWESNDSSDYLDLAKAKEVELPNLKPTSHQKAISKS